ncbi:hypothetical protein OV079_23665 [Nannocystis pusilla]|uniref:Uncharacterized protein n=1 Tax=Nannocystis pusilla TaxID=889268 RepID=A0A9X3IYY7_9BACT|nr:hypothetical protein [Nannocystis pusilla]MCY1008500.1 hypothetical protein [Nannocystis pusilla]
METLTRDEALRLRRALLGTSRRNILERHLVFCLLIAGGRIYTAQPTAPANDRSYAIR